jgi:hypothetical protein
MENPIENRLGLSAAAAAVMAVRQSRFAALQPSTAALPVERRSCFVRELAAAAVIAVRLSRFAAPQPSAAALPVERRSCFVRELAAAAVMAVRLSRFVLEPAVGVGFPRTAPVESGTAAQRSFSGFQVSRR